MIPHDKVWQDICNLLQDAVDNNIAEITLLEEEARAYAHIMGGMMTMYSQYMLLGMVSAPQWLAEEFDEYREIFVRIAQAADDNATPTITLDEINILNKVLDEFISKLLPIAMIVQPALMLPLLLDNPEILGTTDE